MLFRQAFAVILLTLLAFSGIAFSQQKEQRIALVIGNSAYKASPLKNPVNDARDMANSLRGYGFTVIERNNLTVKQIGSTLREFRSKLTAGSVALVFYAGHGIQIKGENYLPAVDADIVGEEDVPNQSLSTRQIMDVLADAKSRMNLVFLDACRDNPFARSFRSSSRGLGRENAPSGTLISFATRPGSTAADGDGRNGLYTSVLLQQIKNTDQPIEQVLKRVVTGVKAASKGQQEPWMEGSIEGDFCFGQCVISSVVAPVQTQTVNPEVVLWESVKDSQLPEDYKVYIDKFPQGIFSELALNRFKFYEQKREDENKKVNDSKVQVQKKIQEPNVFGLLLSDLTETQRTQLKVLGGVLVDAANGPAALAGIKEGDVILALANTVTPNMKVIEELVAKVNPTKPISLLIRRGEWAQYIVIRP